MSYGVQFGAGNIGRGFIGHLLWESGFTTLFVEANEEIVRKLNERGSYPLRLLEKDGTERHLSIDRVQALSSKEAEKIGRAIARAEIVFTAVGVKNLPLIAPLLARGIEERSTENPRYLNVFLCENLRDVGTLFAAQVMPYLSPRGKEFCREKVGFVATVVARMVPVIGERYGVKDPLFIVAESYHRLPFDAQAVKGEIPEITGLVPAFDFQAEVDKKLFFHNLGHAVLAYLGYLKGHAYIHEALCDEEIKTILDGAWHEVWQALKRKYPALNEEEEMARLRDLEERFANPAMMDTVERVGRDPLRKLKPQDRLVGGITLCLSQGILPLHIATGCGAALCYDAPDDGEAVLLQKMLREQGVEKVLREVCALDPWGEVGQKIIAAHRLWSEKRMRRVNS